MDYKVLDQTEKDRIIVEFMLAQERDHYCHTINKERYDKILADPNLQEGDFKERVKQLRAETVLRINEVEHIINHTIAQMPDAESIETVKGVLKEKEALMLKK